MPDLYPGCSASSRYSLDQAVEAYDALNRGEIVGRAIITTGS
jgi:hypothetical protein